MMLYVVGSEQPENLTWEEIEVAMDIKLELTEARNELVGRARDNVAEKSRESARLETVEAMVDVYKR